MPARVYLTRDIIPKHSDGGRQRCWPRLRSKGKVFLQFLSFIKGKKLSNILLDSKYTYSEVTYVTKSAYAGDTGCCGALILAMEHRLNGILGCPEQIRTGTYEKLRVIQLFKTQF